MIDIFRFLGCLVKGVKMFLVKYFSKCLRKQSFWLKFRFSMNLIGSINQFVSITNIINTLFKITSAWDEKAKILKV